MEAQQYFPDPPYPSEYGTPGRLETLNRNTIAHAERMTNVLSNSRRFGKEGYLGAWLLFGSVFLCIAVALGMTGGIWAENSFKTDEFKNYIYAQWVFLGAGILLATGFICYFYYYISARDKILNELVTDTDNYKKEMTPSY